MIIPDQPKKHKVHNILLIMLSCILSLIITVKCNNIEVNPINAKNGYLIFQTGTMEIPTSYEYHYLSINITKTMLMFEDIVSEANNYPNVPQIQYLVDKLKREINGLRIISRSKRGLLNVVGKAYKYLFGALDEDDREELEEKINNMSEDSVKTHDLNTILDVINSGIDIINKLKVDKERHQQIAVLIFNLEQFTEYIEDIELGMQLTRLGIFNPKLLKHDYLKHVNSEKMLKIKTSTWLKTDTNEILIISHIPSEVTKVPIFQIVPYPDEHNYILTEQIFDKFYIFDNQVFHKDTNRVIFDKCIIGIIKQEQTQCKYIKTHKNYQINYIEPNILLTWNIPETAVNQDCTNNKILISGNNIIKIKNCTMQIDEFLISNNLADFTQTIYITNNVTRLEPINHLQTREMIESHVKHYNFFQIICITTFVIMIISLTLYVAYKFKNIPKKIIVKYRKQKEHTHLENNVNENIQQGNNITLYPNLTT